MSTPKKITSPGEFDLYSKQLIEQYKTNNNQVDEIIQICTGGGCIACGSLNIHSELKANLEKRGIDKRFMIKTTGCMGPCSKGPVILMKKSGVFYENIQMADIDELVEKQLLNEETVNRPEIS